MNNLTLVIGIGNRYRSDDMLGTLVVDELRKQAQKGIEVVESDGQAASLMELWQGYSSVIIVDAVVSGAEVGTIHRVDLHKQYLPTNFGAYSSHGIGVAEAIELARVLRVLPPFTILLGMEGKWFTASEQSSNWLKQATEILVEQILVEIQQGENCS